MSEATIKVEELKNFPYNDYKELQKKVLLKEAVISTTRLNAITMYSRVRLGSSFLKMVCAVLGMMPYIIPLIIIVYVVFTKSWLSLISIPMLFIYIFFWPRLRLLKHVFIAFNLSLTLLLLAGIIFNQDWMIIIAVSHLAMGLSRHLFFKIAVNTVMKSALESEEIFCLLWVTNTISIIDKDIIANNVLSIRNRSF